MYRSFHVSGVLLAATTLLAACGGASPTVPGLGNSSESTRISITMPGEGTVRAVATVDGRANTVEVSPRSLSCYPESEGRTCAVRLTMTPGMHVVRMTTYDSRGRVAEVTQRVRIDSRSSNDVAFITDGVPGYVVLNPSPVLFDASYPTQTPVYVTEVTASGKTILGASYPLPITLRLYEPSGSAVTFAGGKTQIVLRQQQAGQPAALALKSVMSALPVSLVATTSGTASATALVVNQTATVAPACSPSPASSSVYIPFSSTPKEAYDGLLHIPITIGNKAPAGARFSAGIDTGSVGLEVSKKLFIKMLGGSGSTYPNPLPKGVIGPGAPGEITYTSDNVHIYGNWWTVPITFGTAAASISTIPMQILVSNGQRPPPPENHATDGIVRIGNMGVGFADSANAIGPIDNPFLQLMPMLGGKGIARRYIINTHGITFGGTAAQLKGFKWIKLPTNAQLAGDWDLASGCVVFPKAPNASTTYACGAFKVDTGYPPSILSLPPGQGPNNAPAYLNTKGNTVQIVAPGNTAPVLNWVFNTPGLLPQSGTGTGKFPPSYPQAEPNGIKWSPTSAYTFINTGLHILYKYDYAYDADCGAIGLRPADPPP
jgi:hypothetical protein